MHPLAVTFNVHVTQLGCVPWQAGLHFYAEYNAFKLMESHTVVVRLPFQAVRVAFSGSAHRLSGSPSRIFR